MLVTIKDLWKIYPMGTLEVQVLKGINLEISEGDFVAVAGPSGSGKTTLMNIIGLIDSFNRGSLTINNKKIAESQKSALDNQEKGLNAKSYRICPIFKAIRL